MQYTDGILIEFGRTLFLSNVRVYHVSSINKLIRSMPSSKREEYEVFRKPDPIIETLLIVSATTLQKLRQI